ncbi:hypothetical protein [uncultured Erythrobacter sp.]|uniref:hypothetical protein n=1 Tax=uncultured Erythrobacter sp. TaxID=263913 RepID=UPI00260B2C10|nr:hypothetical protein [uncultured Erythrobacter sp.]
MSEKVEFSYHQGIAPMMWVLFAISLIELVVVHFFVALKWPMIGRTLTTISALGAIWLVWWILSMKRLPHELCESVLTLRLGTMKILKVELGNVKRITSAWEQGALDKKGIINFAAIAHPNRCLELKDPIEKGKSRIFIRLDDAVEFDRALESQGFEIE